MKITKKYLKQLIIEAINEVSIDEGYYDNEKKYYDVKPGDLVEVSQRDYDRDITFFKPEAAEHFNRELGYGQEFKILAKIIAVAGQEQPE